MTGTKLTAKQLTAIGLMAEGVPYHEIAKRLNVGVRTVHRWAARPDVKQAVADAHARAVQLLGEEIYLKCNEALTRGLPKAISKILMALDNSDARIQIRAADAVVKWSGFYSPSTPGKPAEVTPNAQQNLKDYLAYLESSTNGNQHK